MLHLQQKKKIIVYFIILIIYLKKQFKGNKILWKNKKKIS